MTDLNLMKSDIQKAANLASVPYDAGAIDDVLTAYERGFTSQPSELRTTNKPQSKRSLNFRYLQFEFSENVLEIAINAGLIEADDSPAQQIIAEAYDRFPVIGSGIDGDTVKGLEKLWACLGIGPLDRLLTMETIPDAAKQVGDLYERYHLTKTNILGSDLTNDTMNIYFITDHPEHRKAETWRALFEELDFTVPSDAVLEACTGTPSIAMTFRWDQPGIERVCCYVAYPQITDLPVQFDADLTAYLETVPTQGDTRPLAILGFTSGRNGSYTKLETDYSGTIGLAFQNAVSLPMPVAL